MLATSKLAFWMGSAFCASLATAVIVLAMAGANERGTDLALDLTARLSFLLFWLAYAGSPLTTLFGATFLPLKQQARAFALAFASAHLVHIGLIGWLCHIGAVPSVSTFAFFGFAAFWAYLLAVFSIGSLNQMLGRKGWWLLRTIGLNVIAYAFAVDFFRLPQYGSMRHIVEYLPFAILAVAGPILYVAAWAVQISVGFRSSSYRSN